MISHIVEPKIGSNSRNANSLTVIDVIFECNGKYTSERDKERKKTLDESERDNDNIAKADIIIFFVDNANNEAKSRVLAIAKTKPVIWLYRKGGSQALAYDIAKNNPNIIIESYRSIIELRSIIRRLLPRFIK